MLHTFKKYRLLGLLVIFSLVACDSTPQLQPLSKDAVVLAFGDSLTFGTGTDRPHAYPARLQQLISRTVINAGVPGEVSKTGLTRLGGLLKQHQPALLILCHGGNDILRRLDLNQTKENIQAMIDLAKASNTDVILIAVPQFGIFLSPLPIYEELASVNQLPLENSVLGDILGNNQLKSDQIHPNAEGYEVFAKRIFTLLQKTNAI